MEKIGFKWYNLEKKQGESSWDKIIEKILSIYI